MNKWLIYLAFLIILPCFAYEIYNANNFDLNEKESNLLFVVDFSNSMNEYLEHKTKVSSVKEMLNRILPQISPNTNVGLRVYGHTCNILAYNACRSSELIVPLAQNNSENISKVLTKLRPKGMTPITYSLKQAVQKDLKNIQGKKHIILLTDGGENCDESPCLYAISLIKEHRDINIDVIAFNVNDEDDLAQLKCTSDVTSGRFVEAKTNAQLFNSMQKFTEAHKQVEASIYKPE